jgi:hypothetical protein
MGQFKGKCIGWSFSENNGMCYPVVLNVLQYTIRKVANFSSPLDQARKVLIIQLSKNGENWTITLYFSKGKAEANCY